MYIYSNIQYFLSKMRIEIMWFVLECASRVLSRTARLGAERTSKS